MPATDILGKIGEKVGGQIKSLETSITSDFATKAELTALQSEVDGTQSGAGLSTSGAYSSHALANYIGLASSLHDADSILDTQVSSNATAISNNASDISTNAGNIATNTTDIGNLQTDVGTAQSDITSLQADKLDKAGGTITSNLTISGNLTVSGTTTTVNSTEVSVADNNIEVNLASDGTATATTGGLNVNRGLDGGSPADKAGLIWDNANSTWKVQLGSSDANLTAGTVTADLTGNVTGNVTGDVTGNVSGIVTVPNSNGLVVNTTPLGDYSTFESAFNTAIS